MISTAKGSPIVVAYGSSLEPFSASTHADFCAVVEVELHLVHELPHKEYASAVITQQVFHPKWVWKRIWIESLASILNTHKQTTVVLKREGNADCFLRITAIAVN